MKFNPGNPSNLMGCAPRAGDPIAALVRCGAHRGDRVMIGGNWRVVDGMPVGVDVQALRAAHGEAARRFL